MLFFSLLSRAAEAGASLAELATQAVTVIAQASVVIAAVAAIVSFIAGIITFFTGKSKEQKEAEKRQETAKKKADQARKIVEDRLTIEDLKITLPKSDELEVTWKKLEENVKYKVFITCTDLGGAKITLKEETMESNKVIIIDEAVKYNAEAFAASIQAIYTCRGEIFTGKGKSLSVNATHRLRAPSKVEAESKEEGRELHLTFSQVEFAEDYKAEVTALEGSVIGSAIINRPPEHKDGTHVFRTDKLASGLPGMIKVRVCARSAEDKEGENDFKYSSDLYRVAAPAHFRHSYKSALHELSVEWSVNDAHNISSYLCEIHSVQKNTVVYSGGVATPKDADLSSILKIRLDEIIDKSLSPYQIGVRSLGSSVALASTFVNSDLHLSFLPQVEDISPSYDSQSNQLLVSWTLVTGATKYIASIGEISGLSSPAGNLTVDGHRNNVVFEIENVALKAGIKYAVSVVAEGSDAQHLPSMPSTSSTEFTRLPSPAAITQEYSFEERKIKVTFQPVPDAVAYMIEVFNEKFPSQIAGRKVFPNGEVTCSFDIDNMSFSGGMRFKSRVIAQGHANSINSAPCVTDAGLTCSEAATTVALKYSVEGNNLIVTFASRPGNFTVKVEDTSHRDRIISTQSVHVKGNPKDKGKQPVLQSVLEIPLDTTKEPVGATYQASVLNTGDRQHLPSNVELSNEVPLLGAPDSVEQQYKDGIFAVAWTCVRSAVGYGVRVYNAKTGSTATEMSVTRDLSPAGKQMKKEFNVDSLFLEDNGVYQTAVTVLGNELNIGGTSSKTKTTVPSCSSPRSVKISFNNETRLMRVSCSPVKGAELFSLGVVDADKLQSQDTKIPDALLGLKKVTTTSGDLDKPVEVEFDDHVLISSLDGKHKGVAQVMGKEGVSSLPSVYSLSEDVVSWLKPPVPIHLSFDPLNSTLKITWNSVQLALRYLVEVLQNRIDEKGTTTTLIPFTREVDSLSCDANIEDVKIEETDKFAAKVQPITNSGKVITDRSIGYSSQILVCEEAPTNFEVLQLEDEAVKLRWKGDVAKAFQIKVCRQPGAQQDIITEVGASV